MSRRPSTATSALDHKHRLSRDIPMPAPLIMKTPSEAEVEVPAKTARPKSSKGRQHFSSPDHLTPQDRELIAALEAIPKPRHPFSYKNGKKHHPYPPNVVVYPRSYERSIIDHEVWEELAFQRILGGLTYYRFETPPARVLDLGCGSGAWILSAAREWKNTHFFGTDIVPLYPNLRRIGMHDIADRVTWVHASMLEKFPFPDNYFDFLRIQRLTRTCPEDRISFVIEECTRVLKKGGVFQTIDEDLYFPGSMSTIHDNDESPKMKQRSEPESAVPPLHPLPLLPDPVLDTKSAASAHLPVTNKHLTATNSLYRPDSLDSLKSNVSSQLEFANATTYSDSSDSFPDIGVDDAARKSSYRSYLPPSTSTSGEPNLRKRSVSVTRALGDSGARRMSQSRSLSYSSGIESYIDDEQGMGDDTTLASSIAGDSVGNDFKENAAAKSDIHSQSQSRHSLSHNPREDDLQRSWIRDDEFESKDSADDLYHPSLTQPLNPRDHTLLERIYNEMHAARFINISPLAIIFADLSNNFSPIYTHPPIMFAHPPRPQKSLPVSSSDSWTDELESLLPRVNNAASSYAVIQLAQQCVRSSRKSSGQLSGTKSPMSASDDLASQYVMIDDARLPVTAPTRPKPRVSTVTERRSTKSAGSSEKLMSPGARASKSTFSLLSDLDPTPSSAGDVGSPNTPQSQYQSIDLMEDSMSDGQTTEHENNVPSQTKAKVAENLEIDLKTLHLHLSLRVAETLGCAESMWEWVLEEQERYHSELHRKRLRGLARPPQLEENEDPQMAAIRKMTRAEFDSCLQRFSLDMQDKIALNHALDVHLNLRPNLSFAQSDSDRRSFDTACAAWDAGFASELAGAGASGENITDMSSGGQNLLEQHAKYLSRSLRVAAAKKPDWA